MIKVLFFDLDGTLLNSKKAISEQTKATLKKCTLKGIKLFIATARPPLLSRMLSWDTDILSLFEGGSYYNGGCIEIGGYKEYVPISEEVVNGVIKLVEEYPHLNIALQMEDEYHALRFPLTEKAYASWGITASNCIQSDNSRTLKTVKILIFYENLIDSVTDIDSRLVSSLKNLCSEQAQFYLDKGKCVVITGLSVNKYESIEKIRTRLKLEKDELAVFGDDINDVEMLSSYSNSIAMGNADVHIKNIAKYVTLDNDHDGIHHAILNILNLI